MRRLRLAGLVLGSLGVVGQALAVEPDKASPLYQSKGDQKRRYKFPATGETRPYRTYVPTTWIPGKKLPLVLVLHGGGLTQDAPFERAPAPLKGELQELAEKFGYIIVSPQGYNQGGGFGAPPPGPGAGGPPGPGAGGPAGPDGRPAGAPPPPPVPNPKTMAYSEQDVMNVVEIVEKEYNADTTKEFITGNSMGGIGTVYLAAKYPDKWVAMAPSEAGYDPARYGKNKYGVKGALFIHKQDATAPTVETRTAEMVNILAAEGIDARTISVPNSVHENVWFLSLPVTFHFFDKFAQGKQETR